MAPVLFDFSNATYSDFKFRKFYDLKFRIVIIVIFKEAG